MMTFSCSIRALLVVSFLGLTASASWASDWVASVDERNGLPLLTRGGNAALSSSLDFWGKNWAWTYMPLTFKVTTPYTYNLTSQNKALDFNFSANIQKANQQSLVWDFSLDAKSAQQDVIGGGIVFNFDLANLGQEMGEPVLLQIGRAHV